ARRERLRPAAAHARGLVDLEAHAVAGAVDEATRRRAVLRCGALLARTERVVSGGPDDVLDELVDLTAGDAGPQGPDALVLRAPGDLVHLQDLVGGRALRDRARHVRVIPRGLVLREDVHDDRLVRVERARPDHVRIGRLRPRRDDRALRDAAELEQAALDDRAQPLRGEHLAVELERPVLPHARAADRVDAQGPRVLGRALRLLERVDLVRPLRAPALGEVVRDDELDAQRAQTLGHAEREVRRDRDALRAAGLEEARDDVGVELLAPDALSGELLRAERVDVEDARRARLLANAPLLQRARDDDDLAPVLERDDRIGREEAREVIDVGELVPVGVEEEGKAAGRALASCHPAKFRLIARSSHGAAAWYRARYQIAGRSSGARAIAPPSHPNAAKNSGRFASGATTR